MNTDSQTIPSSILIEGELTGRILAAGFKVLNTLGAGFLEKVYENALILELRKCGLSVESQKAFAIRYEGTVVGDYLADLVVSGKVIVECKAVTALDPVHEAQLMNYLKASGIRVGSLDELWPPQASVSEAGRMRARRDEPPQKQEESDFCQHQSGLSVFIRVHPWFQQ